MVIYIHWTVSISRLSNLGVPGSSFCNPRSLLAQLKNSTYVVRITLPFYAGLVSPYSTCPAVRLVFHLHPFRPVRLDIPPPHCPAHVFSFRRHCHIVTAHHFLRVCPDLAFRFRVLTPPHPTFSCHSRMIFFLYTAPRPIHNHWMHERAVVTICGLPATPLPRPPPMPSCLSLPTHSCRVRASFPIGPVSSIQSTGVSGDPSSGLYQYHTI
jgi:hypothetical protein